MMTKQTCINIWIAAACMMVVITAGRIIDQRYGAAFDSAWIAFLDGFVAMCLHRIKQLECPSRQ